jgi:hypothetical protein
MAVFDSHGDMIDPVAERTALAFAKEFRPTIRVHGGDALDLRWLRGRADDKERLERIEADVDAGLAFLRAFKPTHFLFGNHDHRLVKASRGVSGPTANLADRILLDLYEVLGDRCVKYPWHKRAGVMRLGADRRVIHGFNSGLYAVRQSAIVYGNVLMGHVHSIDVFANPSLEPRVGRSCGCLCRLDMDYNEGQPGTLRQQHGFAYGLIYPNGKTLVWQAEAVDGRWLLPSELREFSREA